jgi:hypothetical protein
MVKTGNPTMKKGCAGNFLQPLLNKERCKIQSGAVNMFKDPYRHPVILPLDQNA